MPLDFGLGIVMPISKFKGHWKNIQSDDFRGITITVMALEIFEHSIFTF